MKKRTAAIKELRRLIKFRTYIVHIWDDECIEITATWESDVSVSIRIDCIGFASRRKFFTLEEVQDDLSQFKSDIKNICNITDTLAKRARKDSQEYFEKLFEEAIG